MAEDLSPADRSSLATEQGPVNMAVGGLRRDLDPPVGVALNALHAALDELPAPAARAEGPAGA